MMMTLLLLLLLQLSRSATSSSSASSSSFSYRAVTALNKYGNSIQLQHARQAAKLHGTPMVAAMSTSASLTDDDDDDNNGIIVVSLQSKRLGIVESSSKDSNPIMHSLSLSSLSKNSKNNNHLAICCTGIKADAKWLIQKLREFQTRHWETYDRSTMGMNQLQEAASQLLLQFMGYPRDEEFNDGTCVIADSDSASSSWSRPMGVQSLLVSHSSKSSTSGKSISKICLMDPSGTVHHDCTAQAIGRRSADIHAKLEESSYDPKQMSLDEVEALLIGILRDVFDLQDAASNDHQQDGDVIVVERLTANGIERHRSVVALSPQSSA